ncbi:DNA primase TraC [Legionella moravica]|uniref:DNA primase TraC n=1 Tax=Legionella moravica TaxID=39962 RepID=A0A378K0E7_9GAMM|nr:DUF5710 domain-containing protein [Legionella moravica]KTD34695.1 DNA primase TraC [Legionella moravica]STX61301.1 DNA primase TraC [Legionella moravica]
MLELIKKFFSKQNVIVPPSIAKEAEPLQQNSVFRNEEKFYINVPYSEKDLAKELGAKWDPIKKSWYVPHGLNQSNFEKWTPQNNAKNADANIRSVGFFIVESLESCWKCKQGTPVFAFLLPENHQTKEYEDEDDEENDNMIWIDRNYKSIVSFASFMNEKCIEIIHRFTSCYYFDFSKQSSESYYMNHCKNCNSKLGDFFMHSEPDGAFLPMSSETAKGIKLYWYNDVFEGSVGTYSLGVHYFENMQISK